MLIIVNFNFRLNLSRRILYCTLQLYNPFRVWYFFGFGVDLVSLNLNRVNFNLWFYGCLVALFTFKSFTYDFSSRCFHFCRGFRPACFKFLISPEICYYNQFQIFYYN